MNYEEKNINETEEEDEIDEKIEKLERELMVSWKWSAELSRQRNGVFLFSQEGHDDNKKMVNFF